MTKTLPDGIEYSVVVPTYGSPESLVELVDRLTATLTDFTDSYEIILVNDGCPVGSWDVVKQIASAHRHVTGISFTRNFGQHMAITAGLADSSGSRVIVMDCDLQDVPEEIPKLIAEFDKGFNYVVAFRNDRTDNFLKRTSSLLFHRVLSYMTGARSEAGVANFGIYSRKVIDNYLELNERVRAFQLHLLWIGFSHSTVPVRHGKRMNRNSGYTFLRLLQYAAELIICFSDKPLRLAVKCGFAISAASMFTTAYLVFLRLGYSHPVEGWTSLIVSIWFLSGIHIMVLGVVGLYVAKSFDENKRRPLYVVDEVVGRYARGLPPRDWQRG